MRFHTFALVATLGHLANNRPAPGRYQYVVSARFEKSYDHSPTIRPNRIYTIAFDLSSGNPGDWKIERILTESTEYRATHYPRLKKFEFTPGRINIVIEPDDKDELGVDITIYNDHKITASYQTMFGSGSCEGRYTDRFDQATLYDRGPSHKHQNATIAADFQFTDFKKM